MGDGWSGAAVDDVERSLPTFLLDSDLGDHNEGGIKLRRGKQIQEKGRLLEERPGQL